MTLFMKLQETLATGRAEGLAEGRAEGLAEGHAKGLAEGECLQLISLIRKKHYKNIPSNEIADIVEESSEFVSKIIYLLDEFPHSSNEEIYKQLQI